MQNEYFWVWNHLWEASLKKTLWTCNFLSNINYKDIKEHRGTAWRKYTMWVITMLFSLLCFTLPEYSTQFTNWTYGILWLSPALLGLTCWVAVPEVNSICPLLRAVPQPHIQAGFHSLPAPVACVPAPSFLSLAFTQASLQWWAGPPPYRSILGEGRQWETEHWHSSSPSRLLADARFSPGPALPMGLLPVPDQPMIEPGPWPAWYLWQPHRRQISPLKRLVRQTAQRVPPQGPVMEELALSRATGHPLMAVDGHMAPLTILRGLHY